MVDAAAALWSAVPTAAVTLTDAGPLNEDVNGSNIAVNSSGAITAPADVTPAATNYPLAVIYDADGSVINAIFGATTSQPDACQNNGVYVWMDNLNPDATIAHAVIILNGLCATNSAMLEMMSFELERAFGRVLGLDYSQVNPGAISNGETRRHAGLARHAALQRRLRRERRRMHSRALQSSATTTSPPSIASIPSPPPISPTSPASSSPRANTISIQGTVSFRTGYGMQGVNVVARPLDANGNPLYQYTVTAVTGALFSGNHGNPVTGFTDPSGNAALNVGLERSVSARFLRSQRHPASARRNNRHLPDHLRDHRSALHSRKFSRPLYARPGRAFRHAAIRHTLQSVRRAAHKPSPSRGRLPVAGFQ